MSISKVFYALIEDKSVIYQTAEFQSDHIIFKGRIRQNMQRCPCCRSSNVRVRETKTRTFRMLSLGKKRTYLKIDTYKVQCQKCEAKAWIQLPFTSGKFPMTTPFINYVLQLTAMTTLLCVALFLGLQWRTVKNIDKANLSKRAKQFSFKKLRYISIDEIAIKKGHKYMTIFTDIATGQIIHAVEGRAEEALRPFLKQLAKKAKRLRGIGIDMSAAYASAVKEHLPKVSIIYDRFHVTKMLNDTIDEIRRVEHKTCQKQGLSVLKGQRFLLLRNFSELEEDDRNSLEKLLQINQPLAIAHSMKEQFRLFWEQDSVQEGTRFLVTWMMVAFESGVELLAKAARTILRHSEGLLSYFKHRINNGKAEGINNKIKVLKRQAYGFHDLEYFKLKLYHLHRKDYALVG